MLGVWAPRLHSKLPIPGPQVGSDNRVCMLENSSFRNIWLRYDNRKHCNPLPSVGWRRNTAVAGNMESGNRDSWYHSSWIKLPVRSLQGACSNMIKWTYRNCSIKRDTMAHRSGNLGIGCRYSLGLSSNWKPVDAQNQFPAADSSGYKWKTAVGDGLLFNL